MTILKYLLFKPANFYMVLFCVKTDLTTFFEALQIRANKFFYRSFVSIECHMIIDRRFLNRSLKDQEFVDSNIKRSSEIDSEKHDDEFIILIRRTIIENMKVEGFGVSMLCKLVCVSRTQLHIKIKSLTNRSTSHYIRFIRIEKACQLLRETNLNITQVSMEIGIDSLPYFSRIFRAEIGLCPHKYRNKFRSEQ